MQKYINKLNKVFSKINTFEYGYLDADTRKHVIMKWDSSMWSAFVKNYHYLSPSEVEKFKIGICLDINNYLYHKLLNKSSRNYMFAIWSTSRKPTLLNINRAEHYFLVNEYKNNYFLIYSSQTNKIKQFLSLADALSYEMSGYVNSKQNMPYITIFKYNDSKYGESYKEYTKNRITDINNKQIVNYLENFNPDTDVFMKKLF